MVLTLDGNSEHVAQVGRKLGLSEDKNIFIIALSIEIKALNRSNKQDTFLRKHIFLNCYIMIAPYGLNTLFCRLSLQRNSKGIQDGKRKPGVPIGSHRKKTTPLGHPYYAILGPFV